jgi:4-amino-4-deoxy-L-arabinose transferase-like glycosyltransferase
MLNLHNILIVPYLIPLFLYGFFIMGRMKEQAYSNTLLVTWFLAFLLGISFAREKDYRYSLLILPSMLLISCIGLSALVDRYSKNQKQKTVLEICVITILLATYGALWPHTQKFLNGQALTFTGFQEAGVWIKKESLPNTMILAFSTREIRYYSNIEFAQFGGQIRLLPVNQMTFENTIKHAQGPIIVEVDRWEKPVRPKWLYPISKDTQQYMANLGFKLAQTINREIYLPNGTKQMMPVIWIFEK